MKILFDHNVDRRLARHLVGHDVTTSRGMGWEEFRNGELIRAAADGGFDALLSHDKNIEYQQNLSALPLAIIVLDTPSNALPSLLPLVDHLLKLLENPLPARLHVLEPDGRVWVLTQPR